MVELSTSTCAAKVGSYSESDLHSNSGGDLGLQHYLDLPGEALVSFLPLLSLSEKNGQRLGPFHTIKLVRVAAGHT